MVEADSWFKVNQKILIVKDIRDWRLFFNQIWPTPSLSIPVQRKRANGYSRFD